MKNEEKFSASSTVAEVIHDPVFEGFGRLLFPVDRDVSEAMTLAEVSNSTVYDGY